MAERTVQIDCICPDKQHEDKGGDTITLRETLDFKAVRAIRYAGAAAREEDPDASILMLMAVMSEGFILYGIESWTLRDGKKPIEVEPVAIRKYVLSDMVTAQIVGDYADAMYQAEVLHPLLVLARRSSQPSPTNGSTSAPNESPSTSPSSPTTGESPSNDVSSTRSATRQKRSRRSSTTSTPTADIVATYESPGGGSMS